MPELTERGLEISTYNENLEALITKLKDIYGDDINVETNSPDGQFAGIFAQAQTDLDEQLLNIWNSLNPEKATGVALDRCYSFNGIIRKAGTYTYVNEVFTFSGACVLKGIEEDGAENAYTVRDNAGNLFYLVNRHTQADTGTATLQVRAAEIGKVEVLPNTINTPVTVVLGVTAVNNPFPAISVGVNEETDFEFRTRRNQSIYAASKGFDESMNSALLALADVTYAAVYDNRYGEYNQYGVPLHGLWCVVEGAGDQEVAKVIYSKLSPGVPLFGSIEEIVTDVYGKSNIIKFDRVGQEALYVRGVLKSPSGRDFDVASVVSYITSNYKFLVNQTVTSNDIISLVQKYNTKNNLDLVAYNLDVSNDNAVWAEYVSPKNIIDRFELTADTITFTKG